MRPHWLELRNFLSVRETDKTRIEQTTEWMQEKGFLEDDDGIPVLKDDEKYGVKPSDGLSNSVMSKAEGTNREGDTRGEGTAAVEVRNLTKRYGGKLVFDGFDLEIERGEVFCLLGPSGCGKTTLLHLIAGLKEPTSGSVRFGGERVEGPDRRRGVVFQDPHLYPWLTVRENIAFGPDLRGEEVQDERVDELIDMIGLEEFEDAKPAALSGGMAQRVSLARTLANEPEMLLMDEPTSALDALTQRKLQDELGDVIRSLGLTTVYVTHDVEEAVYLGDCVAVMSERPSRIKRVEDVNMDERDRESEEFNEKQRKLLGHLGVNGNE